MQTFGKDEKICSSTEITDLFSKGKQLFKHPVKLLWLAVEPTNGNKARVLITVSKRNFKHAVQRNRIKRLLRECYRKNKHLLEPLTADQQLLIGLIFIGKEVPRINMLEPIIIALFQRLIAEHEKTSG